MEKSKILAIISIQVFACCILQVSSTATNQNGGQLLDKSINRLRQDVDLLKNSTQQLRKEFQQSNQQLREEFQQSNQQLMNQFQKFSQQLLKGIQKSIQNLRNEFQQADQQLRIEFQQSNQQLHKEIKQLDSEVKYVKRLHACGPCRTFKTRDLCDCTNVKPMKDCLAFLQAGFRMNGLYRIQGRQTSTGRVFCDQITEGGGYVTILRRQDGSVDFQKSWQEYKRGFGNILTEFWLGNEDIHDLTKPAFAPKSSELLINMRIKGQTQPVYAKYDTFRIGDEASKYILKISGPSGNATHPDYFSNYQGNMKFSTYDADNDNRPGHCSITYGGRSGWWFNSCHQVLLTGIYKFTKKDGEMRWNSAHIQPDFVEMKIRRNV